MNFVDVDTQLRTVAPLVRRCPTAVLRRAYVEAMRDWCNQTRWLRKDINTSTTFQSGLEAAYLVPLTGDDDTYLEVIWINDCIKGTDPTRSRPPEFRIDPQDPSLWDLSRSPGQPRFYAYKPEGMFDLHPTPDRTFNLRISAALQPKDDARFVPDAPLKKFSTGIEAGALEYLFRIPGEPWSSEGKADKWGAVYRSSINNAKADAQRAHNTGSQRLRPQQFIRGR